MLRTVAYLDPGSGSALAQILGGGLAAVAFTAKLFWRRILVLLHIRSKEPEPESRPGGDLT